jgi:hypothetical protein
MQNKSDDDIKKEIAEAMRKICDFLESKTGNIYEAHLVFKSEKKANKPTAKNKSKDKGE